MKKKEFDGVGESIRYWRKVRAYTQKQLCEDICTQGELSKFENNIYDPSTRIIYRLAERLDIPVGKLFEDWGKAE